MEMHQLRYFVAAAEAGSITLAAKRVRVAQPSLSQQIRKLEDTLGAALFDRVGRGVVLTDAGRALLPRARRILAEVADAESVMRDDAAHPLRLMIGAIPTIAPYLLPPVLAELRRSMPRCELIVRENLTANLADAVAAHELDVAVTSTPIDHPLLDVEVVGREALLVVMRPDHELSSKEKLSTSDLRDTPTVTLHEMHCLGEQIGAFCTRSRVSPDVTCTGTQLATVLEFVRLGLGLSLVPEMAAAQDRSGELVYRAFGRGKPEREIALVWRSGRSRPAASRGLAQLVRERLDEVNGAVSQVTPKPAARG